MRQQTLGTISSSNTTAAADTLDALLNMFESGEDGCILDMTAGTHFQDTGKTTVAEDGDPVRVWADRSGLGNDFVSDTDGERPVLSSTGALHLTMLGDMFRGPSAPWGNWPQVSLFAGFQSGANGDAVLGAPHNNVSHQSPFFRWGIFTTSGVKVEGRFNGIAAASNTLTYNVAPQCIGAVPNNGAWYADGAVNRSIGMNNPISYINSVEVRIGENGGSGENFSGDLYFVFLINRALSLTEIELVNTHCQTFFP